KNNKSKCIQYIAFKKDEKISSIEQQRFQSFDKTAWMTDANLNFNLYSTSIENLILSKIEIDSIALIQLCDFSLGLTPYDKYKGHSEQDIANRVFHSKRKLTKDFKPLITGENIIRYFTFPHIEEYIKYGGWLSRPRQERFFTEERIIVRQIASGNPPRIYASYANDDYYFTHHGFAIIPKMEANVAVKYLLALINSRLLNFYHSYKFLDLEKRLFQKVLIENIKTLPIKVIEDQQPFIIKADIIITKYKELYKLEQGLLQLLQAKVEKLTISKNLSDWSSLSFKEFLKELEKQKIKLSLAEQNEWLSYFEGEKAKAIELQQIINKTDKEIDGMVYQLYGLTEDEIKVIENS
ncbi:MAG: TaqI-like C-terminal specificity domain-containing protein, partial [Flavisolibacter sp.]